MRRAKRAGVLDAVLSSGARSAPELRLASGFRGLNSDSFQIRKLQPLNLDLGYLRKCLQPLTGCGNVLLRSRGCRGVAESCDDQLFAGRGGVDRLLAETFPWSPSDVS